VVVVVVVVVVAAVPGGGTSSVAGAAAAVASVVVVVVVAGAAPEAPDAPDVAAIAPTMTPPMAKEIATARSHATRPKGAPLRRPLGTSLFSSTASPSCRLLSRARLSGTCLEISDMRAVELRK
jgi:hypothetical protein